MPMENVPSKGVEKFTADYRELMDSLNKCDAPTDEEIRKLLTSQGVMLQAAGYKLLQEGILARKGDRKVAMALRAYAESRECYKAALKSNSKSSSDSQSS